VALKGARLVMRSVSPPPPKPAPSGANAAEEVVDMAAAAEETGGGRKAAAAGGGGDGNKSGNGAVWRGAGGRVLSMAILSPDDADEDDDGTPHESKTAVIKDTHNKRFWAVGARKLYRAVCVARSSSPGNTPKPGYLASRAAPEEARTIKSKRRPPHCASVGHSIFSSNRSSKAPFSCKGMMPQAEGMEDW